MRNPWINGRACLTSVLVIIQSTKNSADRGDPMVTDLLCFVMLKFLTVAKIFLKTTITSSFWSTLTKWKFDQLSLTIFLRLSGALLSKSRKRVVLSSNSITGILEQSTVIWPVLGM